MEIRVRFAPIARQKGVVNFRKYAARLFFCSGILRQCVNGIQNAVVNKGINRSANDGAVFVNGARVVMRAEAGQLLDSCTEDIVVFLAGALNDFDICAVICSESYGLS